MTLFRLPLFSRPLFSSHLFNHCMLAGISFVLAPGAGAQGAPSVPAAQRASGAFDVSTAPAGAADARADVQAGVQGGSTLGRLSIDKLYHGELAATATGQMLTAVSGTPGSAAYVAIERVSGVLHGRQGSFALHHTGTRSGGVNHLAIAIVPDSGSGQLAGISGTMDIKIVDGKHFYVLEYRLP